MSTDALRIRIRIRIDVHINTLDTFFTELFYRALTAMLHMLYTVVLLYYNILLYIYVVCGEHGGEIKHTEMNGEHN